MVFIIIKLTFISQYRNKDEYKFVKTTRKKKFEATNEFYEGEMEKESVATSMHGTTLVGRLSMQNERVRCDD